MTHSEDPSPLESTLESEEQVVTVTMNFRVVSEELLNKALQDLKDADVWAEGEGPEDNTLEENVEILVVHLDILATHRGYKNGVGWLDVGLERVS